MYLQQSPSSQNVPESQLNPTPVHLMNFPEAMILRSGKSLSKRPKRSSADDENKKEKQDFISRLPNELLIQIVTLLSDAEANRTCILSHRWNPIRAFLPDLRIIMPICKSNGEIKKFHNSVDQTLEIRRDSAIPIQKFIFCASKNCDYHRVYDSLCTVVECKVKKMELFFLDDLYKVRFCWDRFKTCNTLTVLTLKGGFVLRVPKAKVLFPCLKQMKLLSIAFSSKMSFQYLISGCPSLEELFVERKHVFNDGLHTLKVSSPSLKVLMMFVRMRDTCENKVVIDAPNLEILYLLDDMVLEYSSNKPFSPIEARICTFSKSIAKLFPSFASAKELVLGRRTVTTLIVHGINFPVFPNMVKLDIAVDCMREWYFLRILLNQMPNLEHIAIFGFAYRNLNFWDWNPPEDADAPACLHSKVKEIRILNLETVTPEGVFTIMYLLKHSNILEKLTMNAHGIDHNSRELIMNCARGSNLCQIVFL